MRNDPTRSFDIWRSLSLHVRPSFVRTFQATVGRIFNKNRKAVASERRRRQHVVVMARPAATRDSCLWWMAAGGGNHNESMAWRRAIARHRTRRRRLVRLHRAVSFSLRTKPNISVAARFHHHRRSHTYRLGLDNSKERAAKKCIFQPLSRFSSERQKQRRTSLTTNNNPIYIAVPKLCKWRYINGILLFYLLSLLKIMHKVFAQFSLDFGVIYYTSHLLINLMTYTIR